MHMLQRVCLVVNYNLYESKRHFTQKLAEAFNRKGIETKIIDVQQKPLQLMEIVQYRPDLICSFNSIQQDPNQKYFCDLIEIPYLAILVDPVFYSMTLTRNKYTIISCVDRSDCEDLRSSAHFENVMFLPHAVEKDLYGDCRSERPYDLVFIGSCYDYESLRLNWRQELPLPIQKVLDDAIDIILSDSFLPLTQALAQAWNSSGLSPEGVDFQKLFYYMDNYSRGLDRVELVRAIKGAHVHVFGQLMESEKAYQHDWSYYLSNRSNITLHPPVPFSESLEILKRSKLCLSSAPFFKNGTHERIFTGLACGALPIVTDTLYIKDTFKSGEELLVYQPSNRGDVNELVTYFLSNESARQAIVQQGYKKVMQLHTWDQRVEQILQELPNIFSRIYTSL